MVAQSNTALEKDGKSSMPKVKFQLNHDSSKDISFMHVKSSQLTAANTNSNKASNVTF